MKDLIKAFDDLPWIIKLILCIPGIQIIWGVYRVIKSLVAENTAALIISILLIVPCSFFMWIFDFIYVLLNKKVWWIC